MWKSPISGEEKPPEILRKCTRASAVALLLSAAAAFSLFSAATDSNEEFYFQNPPIVLPAKSPSPPPSPTNLSHVVFAIAGSASMWHRRQSYAKLWWDPSRMRGHVWLDEEPSPSLSPWPSTCPPYRISTDASRFGDRASASRIARIVAESYSLGLDNVRWFVMGDDDTVFFPENLVAVLGKYDHREMYYVGAQSESVEQDEMHSYGMAFGGGGFAVSMPTAAALAPAIDGCLDRYSRYWGSDQRVMYCLSEIGVPLTREPGFHQVDIRGDPYGMLAAHPIAPLVSLHHLDYVKPIFPTGLNQLDSLKSMVQASWSDQARILQQTFCYHSDSASSSNWSVSVSWGYTVQIYPSILLPKDLEVPLRTFQTWRSFKDGPFMFNTRELTSDCKQRPVMFFLDRVRAWNNKGTWNGTVSVYSRHEAAGVGKCDYAGSKITSVRVTARHTDPNIWQKAPRRQCCNTQRKTASIMDVSIRDCYPGEITSPPP